MKKKLICTAIILTMITSLTACGSNSASDAASDDGSMAVSTETATDSEAEKETTETASALSANNKGDASDSTNKPATNDSKPNSTTESTAPATEAPRQDSHTTAQAPATTRQPATEQPVTTQPTTTAPPATTEAPAAPATENKECPRSSTGKHKWREIYSTITVVDQEAWDEKIPTGEYYTKLEEHLYGRGVTKEDNEYALTYGVYPVPYTYIDITGMSREQLRQYEIDHGLYSNCLDACRSDWIEVPDYNNPIYTTVHHDAVTHTERVLDYTECTVCGAHK